MMDRRVAARKQSLPTAKPLRRMRVMVLVAMLLALIASGFQSAPAQASLPKRPAPELRLDPLSLSRVAGAWDRFMDAVRGGNTTNALAPGVREPRDEGEIIDGPGFVPPQRTIGSTVSTRDRHEPKPQPVRELVELRTASSETWLNDDGTRSVRMFDRDKYFATGDGAMALIDDRLVADGSGGFVNAAGPWQVRFAALDPTARSGVSVTRTGQDDLVFFPAFVSKAIAPELAKDNLSVTYPNVLPGVDLSYSVAGARVKERIVLRSRPSVASFSFVVEGAALRESAIEAGMLERSDAPTDQLAVLAPFVTDLAGAPIQSAADAKATQRAYAKPDVVRGAKSAKASEITVGVDAAWLASQPDAAFPLVLDPTVTDTGGDTKVFNNSGWSPGLNAFTESFGGRGSGENWRSFLVFSDYSAAAGGTVTEAHIDVSAVTSWGYNQYSPIYVHKATTSNPASWTYSTVDSTVQGSTSFDYTGSIDVTGLVSGWVSASQWNQAVVFKGDESTDPSKKAFTASLVVTYTTNGAPPPAVVNPSPVNNTVLLTDTPSMSVNTVTDPNGDTVSYKFEFTTDPTWLASPSPVSGWLSSPSYTPTAGVLTPNTDYYWRVLTKDSGGLITTPTSGFKLRRAPGQLGYDGLGGYLGGVNTLVGNMVFTEYDVKINTPGPQLALSRTYNTLDTAKGPFGRGWSSPYFVRLDYKNPNMEVQYPDGRREVHTPTSGTGGTLFTDPFTAANGTAWNSTNWSTSAAGTGGTVDVQSNTGRMLVNAAGGKTRALGTAATALTDAEVLTKVKFDTTNGGVFGLSWLRGSTTWNSTDGELLSNGYFVWVQASGAFSISKMVSNVETGLTSTTYSAAANTTFNLRFRAQGTLLQAKIWQDGTTEPSGWTLSTTDSSITTSGRAAVSATGGVSATVTFDDYTLSSLAAGSGTTWAPPAGYTAQLSGAVGATKTLTMGDGTKYTFPAIGGSPTTAWASSITDSAGHVLNLDYSTIGADGKIKLTDAATGRQIRLNTTGSPDFRITSAEINNPAGGNYTWNYTYDTTTYADPVLTKVCDARGSTYCRNYYWTTGPKLYKVTDGKGQVDFELGFSSSGNTTGRVTSIKNALNDQKTFAYSQQTSGAFELTTTMTDERAKDWKHVYSSVGQLIKEYAPGVANPTQHSYDPSTTMRTG
ncbi:MAG: DUF6531 domain-containing protein, partial [Acidimicrobiales bacterium]